MMGAVAVVDRIEQVEAAFWEAICRAMQFRLLGSAETATANRIAPVRVDAYLAQLRPDPTWEVTIVPFE
jgi:hypothetical protein